jgi:hypothetical protein
VLSILVLKQVTKPEPKHLCHNHFVFGGKILSILQLLL